jgi:hypothetical protein
VDRVTRSTKAGFTLAGRRPWNTHSKCLGSSERARRFAPGSSATGGMDSRALPGRVVRQNLGDQEDLFAAAVDSLADEYLRTRSHTSQRCRSGSCRCLDHGAARQSPSCGESALAEAQGVLAEYRDLVSGWQRDGPHGTGHESPASSAMGTTSDKRAARSRAAPAAPPRPSSASSAAQRILRPGSPGAAWRAGAVWSRGEEGGR